MDRENPWNFHTCKFCLYRSKSTEIMCLHVRLHQRPDIGVFICNLSIPELLECALCPFETMLKVDLGEHLRIVHQGKDSDDKELEDFLKCYHCKNCNFETYSVLVSMKHIDDCSRVRVNNFNQKHASTRKERQSFSTEDIEMSEHNYYLLRQRDGNFIISTNKQGDNVEKLGVIIHSSSDMKTLEILKKQLENFIHWQVYVVRQTQAVPSKICIEQRKDWERSNSICATIKINTQNSWVVISTTTVLHKGIYHCNLIAHDKILKAVIIERQPESHHICELNTADPSKDWTYALLFRKPTEVTAKLTVKFCGPIGQYEGDEFSLTPDELITPLKFRRIFSNKKHYCYYCKKMRGEMTLHLFAHHSNEPEVAKIMQMKIDSEERSEALQELFLKGDRQVSCRKQLQSILSCTQKPVSRATKVCGKKRHCCYYCEKMFVEITSHLRNTHAKEAEMVKILQMEPNSKECNKALKELRLKGDHAYNKRVAPHQRIIARRLTKGSTYSCVTCRNCLQVLSCQNFSRHERRCTGRPPNWKRVVVEAAAADYEQLMEKENGLEDEMLAVI